MLDPEPKPDIRPAASPADYVALQAAQRLAWGLADDAYVVPVASLVGAAHHGGLALGAFLEDGRAVGVSFAFLGRSEGRWCLYSQLTGVVPGWQGRGVGRRLKEYQREHARSIEVGFIAWAFDPLQVGNAAFNLGRLGASSGRYVVDMYGPRTDALNLGAPTDRLIAEWPVDPAPRPEPDLDDAPFVVEGPDEPHSGGWSALEGSPRLLLEIPPGIVGLRASDPARAGRWLEACRRGFRRAFESGYRAVDVVRGEGRAYYVLERRPSKG